MAVPKLPAFNQYGVLPPADYELTFSELKNSSLVNHHTQSWDRVWRLHLIEQCEIMVKQLWAIGITEIYLDGSFVEEKAHPSDIDGYFVCDLKRLASGDLERELNALDLHKVWTWQPSSRRFDKNTGKKQLPMWHQYRTELYPHFGQLSGIRDPHGFELTFPSAFRRQRNTDQQKGILKILPEGGNQT
jgi:hypothetical protein